MSLPAKKLQTENTLFESRAAPLASRTVEAILLTVLFFCHQPTACTIWIFFLSDTMTNNYQLLMADSDKITNNFTFLCFKELVTFSFCTSDGQKGLNEASKDG